MGEITVGEFRQKIINRLYLEKFRHKNEFNYEELIRETMFISNRISKENKLEDVWARLCGRRLFLFYRPTNRIVCEIGIDGTNVLLVNLKGLVPDSLTMNTIIARTKELGARKKKGLHGRR